MNKSCLLILVSFSFFLGACGHKVRTTNVATTTGGALGAAIGAMVGNQTGSTAGGFILGGAAGAGAGHAIGKTLEGQENQIANQREEIARQNQMLAAQQAELDELKRLSSDGISYKNNVGRRNLLRRSSVTEGYQSGALAKQIKRNIDIEERGLNLNRNTNEPRRNRVQVANNYENKMNLPAYQERSINPVNQIKRKNPVIQPKIAQAVDEKQIVTNQDLTNSNIASKKVESEVIYNLKSNSKKVNRKGSVVVSDLESDYSSSARGSLKVKPKVGNDKNEIKRKVILMDEAEVSNECKEAKKEYDSALKADEVSDKLYHYRRALRLCPNHAGYHTGLGKIYLSLNRYEDARYEFKEALKIDPDFNPAKEQLTSME